jgi:NADH:ubiquinone oxidoreductase subunit H
MTGISAAGIDLAFFLLKVIVVMFFSVTLVRVVMARFRINTLVSLYWGWLTTIGLIGMLLIIFDGIIIAGGCL